MSNCPACGHVVIPNESIAVYGDSQIGFTAWVKSAVPIELTPLEARILKCMRPAPIERPALLERVYVGEEIPDDPDASLRVALSKLRRKLEPQGWMVHYEGRQGREKGSMGIYDIRRLGESA